MEKSKIAQLAASILNKDRSEVFSLCSGLLKSDLEQKGHDTSMNAPRVIM